MAPSGLTVFVPIRQGDEARLRAVLQAIGNDIKGNTLAAGARPHIHFPRSTSIHFARFAILDDPDRGTERRRLLYSANFDGSLEDHLRELMAVTTDMDAIWGACEGYESPGNFLVSPLRPGWRGGRWSRRAASMPQRQTMATAAAARRVPAAR